MKKWYASKEVADMTMNDGDDGERSRAGTLDTESESEDSTDSSDVNSYSEIEVDPDLDFCG